MSSRRQGLSGLDGQSHEYVHWVADHATGLRAIGAIHDTARGLAFGGCRMRPCASESDGLGVHITNEASVRRHLNRSSPAGTTVAVQGLGAVGSCLCELLHAAGARLYVADVNPVRVASMQSKFDAVPVQFDDLLSLHVDVFSSRANTWDQAMSSGLASAIDASAPSIAQLSTMTL
jgi:glutamate dehydrogenase/leucine dehydrogenase